MSRHYLRVEAVNLAHFVYDTEDLSTVRGGGLMLLDSPREVETLLAQIGATDVTRITAGASQAVFAFTPPGTTSAADVRMAVEAGLREVLPGDPLRKLGHATFVVDVCPAGPDLSRDKEKLLALNRWRQMGQLRLAVPPENTRPRRPGDWPYCGVDLVRPAVVRNHARNDDKRHVSESVKVRADYGRGQKRDFYRRLTGVELANGMRVANHFHEIAARGNSRVGEDLTAKPPDPFARLDDKIAVVYVDGNNFGSLGRGYATNAERQAEWDAHVQDFRKKVLTALLGQINGTGLAADRWRCSVDGETVARLETLLWGGDELVWVVPAWKGWDVVRLFFEEAGRFYGTGPAPASPPPVAPPPAAARPVFANKGAMRDLNAPRKSVSKLTPAATPSPVVPLNRPPALTHACGLVFAHAAAPIQGLIRHAKDLADVAKDEPDRKQDAVAYAVLESLDAPPAVDALAAGPIGFTARQRVVRGHALPRLLTDLRGTADRFPRGTVYRLLRAIRAKKADEYARWLARAEREAEPVPRLFPRQFDGAGAVNWLHLAELWDYLPEG